MSQCGVCIFTVSCVRHNAGCQVHREPSCRPPTVKSQQVSRVCYNCFALALVAAIWTHRGAEQILFSRPGRNRSRRMYTVVPSISFFFSLSVHNVGMFLFFCFLVGSLSEITLIISNQIFFLFWNHQFENWWAHLNDGKCETVQYFSSQNTIVRVMTSSLFLLHCAVITERHSHK